MDRRGLYSAYLPGAMAVALVGVLIPWLAKGYAATQDTEVPSFFPWWTQALAVGALLLALWRAQPRRTPDQRNTALGALTLISLQFSGIGAVALRHADPSCGMQGCVSPGLLRFSGALLALAGILGLALCLGKALLGRGGLGAASPSATGSSSSALGRSGPHRTALDRSELQRSEATLRRLVLWSAAVVLLVLTPLLAGWLSNGRTVTAIGAALLCFGGPWAIGLGLAAVLDDPAFTRGVLLVQVLVAAAAMIGPVQALYSSSHGPSLAWIFVPGLLIGLALRLGPVRGQLATSQS